MRVVVFTVGRSVGQSNGLLANCLCGWVGGCDDGSVENGRMEYGHGIVSRESEGAV